MTNHQTFAAAVLDGPQTFHQPAVTLLRRAASRSGEKASSIASRMFFGLSFIKLNSFYIRGEIVFLAHRRLRLP